MKLLVVDGPERGRTVPLVGECLVLGRHSAADLSLPGDSRISRRHCRLVAEDGGWVVEDCGSENGTVVDDETITGRVPLREDSVLRLGRTRVLVAAADADPEAALESFVRRDAALSPIASEITRLRLHGGDAGTRVDAVVNVQDADVPADEEAESLRRRLAAFVEVARAVAGSLESRGLLEAVLDAVLRVVPARRGFVLEVDEESTVAVRCVVARTKNGGDDDLQLSRTILRRAIEERVGVLVSDTLSESDLAGARSVVDADIRSALTVPLVDDDRVVALLHLDTSAVRAFGRSDLELVAAMARQAELSIGNARLYESLQEAYEELKAAQERLVQTEKLTAIGTLAASIAHDVGNVLTPIRAVARKVMRDDTLDPRMRDAFERQMQRLEALTQQLLSFSRPSPPQLVPTDLNDVVARAIELVATEARHADTQPVTELDDELPSVLGDANRLDQVVINLSLNAVHAMAETGGTLTLRTRADGDTACLDVVDTGCGIAPEAMPRVFQPFFTTKGEAGTGMGLYSCRRIVEEEHGGRLEVESEVGRGTTFTVRLPVAPAS